MSDLTDFMMKNKPTHRSKLQPYLNDIQTLWVNGYSERDILRYLSEKKMLVVTRKTLHLFILKNIQNPMVQANQTPPETEMPQKQATNTSNETALPTPRPQIKKGIKKFDWKNATTEGLI